MVWPWSRNKQLNTQSKPHFLYYFVYDSYIYLYKMWNHQVFGIKKTTVSIDGEVMVNHTNMIENHYVQDIYIIIYIYIYLHETNYYI